MNKEKLKVDPIKNGTVIDHITAGKALQVAEILNIGSSKREIMVGINLSSKKMGKKDIIKIENREISKEEANSIALISPTATLIIIDDYKVVKKFGIDIPKEIKQHIICPNSNCITNIEQVQTRFELAGKFPVEVRCAYCEKKYFIEEVGFSF
ncbi:MAG: aspartate carbamoyltransferase regulatory subunit [Bacteroidales bacterium]|nr:aspartate carbamoyltransferase regulatory subunit [Bacteroidales bacterium]